LERVACPERCKTTLLTKGLTMNIVINFQSLEQAANMVAFLTDKGATTTLNIGNIPVDTPKKSGRNYRAEWTPERKATLSQRMKEIWKQRKAAATTVKNTLQRTKYAV
jgi:sulfatase maturation enzyme AslB (radical SAM superfamily)